MHAAPWVGARGGRIWLFAGTGEGPVLAQVLLQRGWRLRISVVSPQAARAYGTAAGQELQVGALAGQAALAQELLAARRGGEGFTWVVDASHPFARRISASLASGCADLDQPLVRLQRPLLPLGRAEALGDLSDRCASPPVQCTMAASCPCPWPCSRRRRPAWTPSASPVCGREGMAPLSVPSAGTGG
jgi:hypothetical protein